MPGTKILRKACSFCWPFPYSLRIFYSQYLNRPVDKCQEVLGDRFQSGLITKADVRNVFQQMGELLDLVCSCHIICRVELLLTRILAITTSCYPFQPRFLYSSRWPTSFWSGLLRCWCFALKKCYRSRRRFSGTISVWHARYTKNELSFRRDPTTRTIPPGQFQSLATTWKRKIKNEIGLRCRAVWFVMFPRLYLCRRAAYSTGSPCYAKLK